MAEKQKTQVIQSCTENDIRLLVPSLNPVSRLLSSEARRNVSPRHNRQSNACLPIQAPSDTNRVNITQLQTMSNTFLSCGLREPPSLSDSVETDSVCTQISHLPRALRPWPGCVGPERPAEVGQTWQEALIYSHFEIKRGRGTDTKCDQWEGTSISCRRWKLDQGVFADLKVCFKCQRNKLASVSLYHLDITYLVACFQSLCQANVC